MVEGQRIDGLLAHESRFLKLIILHVAWRVNEAIRQLVWYSRGLALQLAVHSPSVKCLLIQDLLAYVTTHVKAV